MRLFFKYLVSRPFAFLGAAIVLAVVLIAFIGPSISPYDPEAMNLAKRLLPPVFVQGGHWKHPLGTDMYGKDIFSRLICGTRSSILVGVTSTLLALMIGVFLGMVAGYLGGKIDIIVMRLVDIMLALPPIMLAVVLVAIIGPHPLSIVIALGLTLWSEYAKVIRSRVLTLKEEAFILASKSMGASNMRVIFKHIFPNISYIIIVIFTLQIGLIILWSAGLSFIGLGGVTLSWGWDVAAGRSYLTKAWWLSTIPGVAIFVTVLGFNLFGDWLRDALDPTTSRAIKY